MVQEKYILPGLSHVLSLLICVLCINVSVGAAVLTFPHTSEELNRDSLSLRERRVQRVEFVDSILSIRYFKKDIDTAYIMRPRQRLTLKTRVNLSGAGTDVYSMVNESKMTTKLSTDFRATFSLAAVYRGIGVGFALNPLKWSGRSKDFELNLNSYGNRFGGEIVYLSSKTFHGDMTSDAGTHTVDKGLVAQDALNLNLYYTFNYRKFSFPAAFSQSYIQRRSAGSWMLGLSSEWSRVKITANEGLGIADGSVRMAEVGIGGGYGYNFVARRWLFHISSVPTLIVYLHDRAFVGGERLRMNYSLTNAIITARGSIVYTHKNRFYGASCVFNFSSVGDEDYLQIRRTKWRVRLFAGIRL